MEAHATTKYLHFLAEHLSEEIPRNAPSIPVGILASLTGELAVNERGVARAALLAIEEINTQLRDSPGSTGHYLQPLMLDGASSRTEFGKHAQTLLEQKVAVIFGCWTSATRKIVLARIEEHKAKNNGSAPLLVYPVQFEGLERSDCAIYLGALPCQHVFPALHWRGDVIRAQNEGEQHRCIIVGSDYIYPRAAVALTTRRLRQKGNISPPHVYFTPLRKNYMMGADDVYSFDQLFEELTRLQYSEYPPNLLLNFVNGQSNLDLFRGLKKDPWLRLLPTISFSMTPAEVQEFSACAELGGDRFNGNDFIATTYHHREESGSFGKYLKERCRIKWITTDAMWNVYLGVHLWHKAAVIAGSTDRNQVRLSLEGLKEYLPTEFCEIRKADLGCEHFPRFDGKKHFHAYHQPVLLRIVAGEQNQAVTEKYEPFSADGYAKTIHPIPFPEGSGTVAQWESYAKRLWFASDEMPRIKTFPYVEEMRRLFLQTLQAPSGDRDWLECHRAQPNVIDQFYSKYLTNPHTAQDWVDLRNWLLKKRNLKAVLAIEQILDFARELGCSDTDFITAIELPKNERDLDGIGLCGAKLLAFCSRQRKERVLLFDLLDYANHSGNSVFINQKAVTGLVQLKPIISSNFGWENERLDDSAIANCFGSFIKIASEDGEVLHRVDIAEERVEYVLTVKLRKRTVPLEAHKLLAPLSEGRSGNVGPLINAMRLLFGDILSPAYDEKNDAKESNNEGNDNGSSKLQINDGGCIVINNCGCEEPSVDKWWKSCQAAGHLQQFRIAYWTRGMDEYHTMLFGYVRWEVDENVR